ncbi:MAG TPA: hypothetical protein VF275_05835 [Gammaproteobacteria bacterium]
MNRILLAMLASVVISPAFAAEPFEFDADEPEFSSTFAWRGDIQLRADAIDNLDRVSPREDFRRGLFRLRAGFDWIPNESFQFSALARINRSDRTNEDSRTDLDNELADSESIDELFVQFTPDTGTRLALGQMPLPLNLSPALWDNDLRPIGGFLAQDVDLGAFNRLRFQIARFNPNHPFFDEPIIASAEDSSRVSATQIAMDFGHGKRHSWHVRATYLEFENISSLVPEHLARTNRVSGGTFLNAFSIADLQFSFRKNQGMPLEFAVDVFRNLDAADGDDGGRVSLRLGDALQPGGVEFGVASQRIQRDAIMAAFGDDDWWFRSWMRGTRAWFGYGITENSRIQLALFRERRDDWDDHLNRGILDFRYTF